MAGYSYVKSAIGDADGEGGVRGNLGGPANDLPVCLRDDGVPTVENG